MAEKQFKATEKIANLNKNQEQNRHPQQRLLIQLGMLRTKMSSFVSFCLFLENADNEHLSYLNRMLDCHTKIPALSFCGVGS